VNFLDPGTYSVSAEAQGFKKLVRSGIILNTGDRLAVDLAIEIGPTSQSVEVTADAPLLETTNAAGGRVLDTRDISQLPFTTMNPFNLQAISPGILFTGTLGNNRVMDHAGTASYNTNGIATSGGNQFMLDGSPVTGTNGGRAGYVPSSETVAEMRIETSPFDASQGHTIGITVSAVIKSGTNSLHGSGFWQTQQFRWNATNHFTRLNYYAQKAAGTLAPGTPENPGGKFSQPGFGVGGPVYIPKVIDGRNRLFFYISFSKITQKSPPINNTPLYTVPTEAERQGDFSALLPINPVAYTIYDPRSAVAAGGRVTRAPFPNNVLPASVQTNPIYKFMSRVYPLPNNPAGLVQRDGTNNYYDGSQPNNDFCPSLINRYDYNVNDRHRLNGKWYYNHRFSDQYDWGHTTPLAGMYSNGLWRPTRGGSVNWTYTITADNVMDAAVAITQYAEGSRQPIKTQYKASDVGLPAYLDQKAGTYNGLPAMTIQGFANAASTSFMGYPGLNQRGTTNQLSLKATSIRGRHTFKYGWDERRYHYATVNPGGYTTGYYTFDNTYFKQADNTTTASNLGLGWASFLMGVPSAITLNTNDTGYYSTPYHAFYLQGDFRVTSRLRLGYGLRFEREGGTSERFNRGLSGAYDFDLVPVYASAVQAAYAASAIPQLAASQFTVKGGPTYLGQPYKTLTDGTRRFLPNLSLVYQINRKTVLRTGVGWFADTFNALVGTSTRQIQNGYSQATSTTLSTDSGASFCCGAGAAAGLGGRNPMMDPFPVLAGGSRWVMPYDNALGPYILAGQGFTPYKRDYKPALQQRWRLGFQREIFADQMVEASYNGAHASVPMTRNLSYLPARYWNFSNVRNNAVDAAMTATVPNPFNIANLASLQQSNATLYNYLSTISWFNGKTLQTHQLLRAYPNSGAALNQYDGMRGRIWYHDLQLMYQKRFSKGVQSAVMFTRVWGRQQWLPNQFDQTPAWQPNASSRPNRLVWTTIWELPFGRGQRWIAQGPLEHLAGGWQLSWIYQAQTGALISWGNLFAYGSVDQIVRALNHDQAHAGNIHLWFDPNASYNNVINPSYPATGAIPSGFVGFEGRTAFQPGTYQARVFPQYIDSLRADGIRNWDLRVQRRFRIYERLNFTFALDLMNLTNHTQFAAPNIGVTASNFGTVTATANQPRIVQFNLRVEF
jgi:hypothetical protein